MCERLAAFHDRFQVQVAESMSIGTSLGRQGVKVPADRHRIRFKTFKLAGKTLDMFALVSCLFCDLVLASFTVLRFISAESPPCDHAG